MHTSHTSWYRVQQVSTQVSTREQSLAAETRESEKKTKIEQELWGQQVKKEALEDACRGKNSVAFCGIEAQLKRVSEQVTRDAQEKQKRTMLGF